jgi:Flp pilus assembly protein TadG
MTPLTKPMMDMWLRVRRSARDMFGDIRGLAATEFAIVVPVMLLLFFGTDEFASGIAVNRKVTLVARTLSDLTSQNISVTTNQLNNIFSASTSILTPYPSSPVNARIVELYIDANLVVHQIWAATSGTTPPTATVIVPTALKVAGSYLIYSEVNYNYVPTVGYVLKNSITLSDFTFTRPRQSSCVIYPTANPLPLCPTS